uniref:WGS project CAEQ00000000 data, annotated contig 1459 n=1 Tax=Trypanosoma congolense (strain IL3000) TaxID=1068625 RepID=F9W6F7_TRYCI|nr:unnamed protein product [Trypanosoma congolense IL3000]
MNANVPLPSSDDSTARLTHSCDKHAVTNSLLMAELMSVAPVSGNSVKREGDEQNNNKKRRVGESRNEEVSQALQGLSCLSEHGKWKFRSCRMPGNDFLNPVSATPCGKKDAKVQLLRPSKEVPWPFTLDVVSSPVNSSSDQDGRLHGKCVDDGDAHASFHSSGAGDFISAVAEKEVRMCFDRSWLYGSSPSTADDGKVPSNSATATGPFPTTLSTVDLRHVMQFQRLLEFHGGRLLSLNGCPSHKLDPIRSIARNALRLIVRFR